MKSVIITASDEGFMPLTRGLIESLHQWDKTNPLPADIAFFDLGLSPSNLKWMSKQVSQIIVPGWDLPVSDSMKKKKPEKRAQTIRPFLPKYLPGYDVYMWIDADAWIQEDFVISDFLKASEQNYLTIVAEEHPSYIFTPTRNEWIARHMREYFGNSGAKMEFNPYYNCGIFSLRADAPHWNRWAAWFRFALERTGGNSLIDDQNPLNYLILKENLPVHLLPAKYNWLCCLSLPYYDSITNKLCDSINLKPLGIIHMPWVSKNAIVSCSKTGKQRSLRFDQKIENVKINVPD